ncbi:MAG: sulfate reduction electron transfer complex DsrMKJOP subunit DsrP [Isosphaeraceae bacterium]
MLEKAFRGSPRYWLLLGFWVVIMLVGLAAYSRQWTEGLTVTGLSRDVTWGLYIAQFTFLVGVAASAVMVVLPYYLHHAKAFKAMVILGEFLAVSAVLMCMLFIFVDMGQPRRVLNMILYPSPHSIMFWDMIVLTGYLLLNLVIGGVTLEAERQGAPPPSWIKPLIYLSIPWAVSIHTVTAFLFSGLAARPFWMTPILAPRFLASAFASGPSLLILLALLLRKFARFDVGSEAIQKLATIVTYALIINLFFVLMEVFTVLYSNVPHDLHPFEYLFWAGPLAPWMWIGELLALGCVVLLLVPALRRRESVLAGICLGTIIAIWIEKGMGMVVTGFVPSPLGKVAEYHPTAPEILIVLGVYAAGLFVLSLLCKIVVSVREHVGVA